MVDPRQMFQQIAVQQKPAGFDPARVEQAVDGKEAAARIGKRARQRRCPGQQAAPLGAEEILELGGKATQLSTTGISATGRTVYRSLIWRRPG